jgi:PAS domain S-box-containing protein
MKVLERVRDLPVGTQFTLTCMLLSLLAIALVSTVNAVQSGYRMRAELQAKAVLYANQLRKQLEPVVAFEDAMTAREIFESLSADADIAGLAAYRLNGEPIDGYGNYPPRFSAADSPVAPGPGLFAVVGNVMSKQGVGGQLYVGLSRRRIERVQLELIWIASGTAAFALLVGLTLTVPISRHLSNRITHIAEVATGIAAGNFAQPPIEEGARDEIGDLAVAVNRMGGELSRMFSELGALHEARHLREHKERMQLEQMVVDRSCDLAESQQETRGLAKRFELAVAGTSDGLWDWNLADNSSFCSPRFKELVGLDNSAPEPPNLFDWLRSRMHPEDVQATALAIRQAIKLGHSYRSIYRLKVGDAGAWRWIESRGAPVMDTNGRAIRLAGAITDITERKEAEQALQLAARMASVGTLASGIAHEINTPVQFVNDSVQFLRDAAKDCFALIEKLQQVSRLAAAKSPDAELQSAITVAVDGEEEADLEYLHENVPKAFERCIDGLDRVSTIVRSMKEFAHPSLEAMAPVDLNRAIGNTLTIARNEYKYVAEMHTEFGEIPPVRCYINEINQVVLNLVVNAAHAIADVVKGTEGRGAITVCTRTEGEIVVISITDTGGGIPVTVGQRIFEPFFTTKEVGKGTGQGLALAWTVVKDKHGGELSFETMVGKGTTFFIRLPIAGKSTCVGPKE